MTETQNKPTQPSDIFGQYIFNCVPSVETETDWSLDDAIDAGVLDTQIAPPDTVDLRESWWPIEDQGQTGACVGYATAYGVLKYALVKARRIAKDDKPSARFIWMANKETDNFTSFPSSFLETSGTSTKLALRVAQKYGCVLEQDLPMNGALSRLDARTFYTRARRNTIASYHNIGARHQDWKFWLANKGPILTRLNVDQTWMDATKTNGKLGQYRSTTAYGGHAVCIVGYTKEHFIIRNSWGTSWGDKGFAYASPDYAKQAFDDDTYGAIV
jgi:C1A family cysteine protease